MGKARKDWDRSLKIHPLAEALPVMPEPEYQALKADIAANGLREPIVLFGGRVLDGRHRYRACTELAAENRLPAPPEFDEFTGSEPEAAAYVASLNLLRRHLSKSQKAMVLVSAGFVSPPPGGGRRRQAGTGRDAIMDVGRKYGVNHMTLYKAAYVYARDRALADRVKTGEMSVSAAEKMIREREEVRRAGETGAGDGRPRVVERVRELIELLREAEAVFSDAGRAARVPAAARGELKAACGELSALLRDRVLGAGG